MCGNALRCVGKYLYETGAVRSDCMSVETLGGVKPLRVSAQNGRVTSVAADMGEAKLGETVKIDLGGRETAFLTVDMGNPHAVTYDLFPATNTSAPAWSAIPTSPSARTWSSAARRRPRGRRCASGSAARGRRWPAAPAPRRPSRRAWPSAEKADAGRGRRAAARRGADVIVSGTGGFGAAGVPALGMGRLPPKRRRSAWQERPLAALTDRIVFGNCGGVMAVSHGR